MENPIKIDDLGFFPLFLETPIYPKTTSFFLFNPPPLLIVAGASGQSLFNTLMQAPRSVNFHTIDFIWEPTEIQIGGFLVGWGFLWNL